MAYAHYNKEPTVNNPCLSLSLPPLPLRYEPDGVAPFHAVRNYMSLIHQLKHCDKFLDGVQFRDTAELHKFE